MMQMLEAGGLPPKTDRLREADADNPKGYYEWEEVKHLTRNPNLFLDEEGLDGQALKVVSMLLPHLSYNHDYKVIFMTRPIEEVVASQRLMVERRKTEGSEKTDEDLANELEQHRNQTFAWMQNHPRLSVLEVYYPDLVKNPKNWVPKIVEFLGSDRISNPDSIYSVIDQTLHHQKSS